MYRLVSSAKRPERNKAEEVKQRLLTKFRHGVVAVVQLREQIVVYKSR